MEFVNTEVFELLPGSTRTGRVRGTGCNESVELDAWFVRDRTSPYWPNKGLD